MRDYLITIETQEERIQMVKEAFEQGMLNMEDYKRNKREAEEIIKAVKAKINL